MAIQFFKRDKHNEFYIAEWKTGYIQVWEDWSQYFRPKNYNWLNFRPIWFEIDYDKLAGENFSIEFGLLGFNLRFHQFIKDNEHGKKMKKQIKEIELFQDTHKKEVKKLKLQINRLKKQLKEKK